MLTQFDFLKRAYKVHNNIYDYSKAEYKGSEQKILIICRKHGNFFQKAGSHLMGSGCKKCGFDRNRHWTHKDIYFLKENYSKIGAKECAKILNKTASSVMSKANILNLVKKKNAITYEEIPNFLWKSLLNRAKRYKIEVDIKIEDIWDLYVKQDKKCALTGWNLIFSKVRALNTVSVDRIDSYKGYIKGNIQLLHKDVNLLKLYYSEEYFYKVCKSVTSYRAKDFNFYNNGLIWDVLGDREYPDMSINVNDMDFENLF